MTLTAERTNWLNTLREFPAQLEELIRPLSEAQLHQQTAADPWTIAQIVHHCADSHMNSFVRLKLTLTEDQPPLKNYEQDAWVAMADAHNRPIEPSLQILRGLHVRWVQVFEAVQEDEWARYGIHSTDGPMTVEYLLSGYHEHCQAHLAQIGRIREAMSN